MSQIFEIVGFSILQSAKLRILFSPTEDICRLKADISSKYLEILQKIIREEYLLF